MTDYKKKSKEIRRKIVEITSICGGHIASSFSYVDILVAIYYSGIFKHNPGKPDWQERDKFILSKGHGETALFTVLADLNYFPEAWLNEHYRRGNCYLGGHPDYKIPGVEITTGALGHGLGIASGIALASKKENEKNFHYVLMGDAECTEGSVWEAALFAAKHKLNNLIAIIDYNKIGSIDFIENFTSIAPFKDKWEAFGWEVMEIDGHNFKEIISALKYSKKREKSSPLAIIAHTVKGKGVSFIENDPTWHVKKLSTTDEIDKALSELK